MKRCLFAFLLMLIVHDENDAGTSIGQLSLEELSQYQDPSQMLAKQEIIVLLRASPPWGTTFSICLKSRYKSKTANRFHRTVEYYDTQGLSWKRRGARTPFGVMSE
uniref:Putative secreted protein n=1 Tax=Amblyomma tuberculatum TaxID=48802 RepID=A0A6M2E4J7_9ACAR